MYCIDQETYILIEELQLCSTLSSTIIFYSIPNKVWKHFAQTEVKIYVWYLYSWLQITINKKNDEVIECLSEQRSGMLRVFIIFVSGSCLFTQFQISLFFSSTIQIKYSASLIRNWYIYTPIYDTFTKLKRNIHLSERLSNLCNLGWCEDEIHFLLI